MTTSTFDALFPRSDSFLDRHLGPRRSDLPRMLETLGLRSMDQLVQRALPEPIRWNGELQVPAAAGEAEAIAELKALAQKNQVWRSCRGMGYHGTLTPPVILRNILENPGW